MAGDSDEGAAPARRLASAVLPTPEDLWGRGWVEEEESSSASGVTGGLDECLPDGFPEDGLLVGADVTYRRDADGLVHAASSVFADANLARVAWTLLAGEGFADCFVASVVADAPVPEGGDVLGPVFAPAGMAVDRAGWRIVRRRAALSYVRPDDVLPIVLDMAVLVADAVVLVLWAVGPGAVADHEGWDRLLARVELRCEAAFGA